MLSCNPRVNSTRRKTMDWKEILIILVPILSLMAWFYSRLDKRFDKVDQEFKEVKSDMSSIKDRLSHLEGSFAERGRSEFKAYIRA